MGATTGLTVSRNVCTGKIMRGHPNSVNFETYTIGKLIKIKNECTLKQFNSTNMRTTVRFHFRGSLVDSTL